MLGVEIGEEFKIEGYDDNFKLKITENKFLHNCGYGWVNSWLILDVLEGKAKIVKIPRPILDEKEKEYLSYVIKPFRSKVISICKCAIYKSEWIQIGIDNDTTMAFPMFEKGTMYEGMAINKKYSTEELGL